MGRSSKVAIWVWSPRFTELEAVGAGDLALEAQAARAEHAALGVEHDRPEVDHLALLDLLLELDLGVVEAVLHVLVLQVALAGLVADRAVDRVVDEQELERGAVGLRPPSRSAVCTTMPSVTAVLQAICSLGIFSISTRHMRQLPSTGRSGCQQKWGISIPSCGAAWMTVVPGGDLDLLAVDRALGHSRYRSSSPAMTFRPPMMATASAERARP